MDQRIVYGISFVVLVAIMFNLRYQTFFLSIQCTQGTLTDTVGRGSDVKQSQEYKLRYGHEIYDMVGEVSLPQGQLRSRKPSCSDQSMLVQPKPYFDGFTVKKLQFSCYDARTLKPCRLLSALQFVTKWKTLPIHHQHCKQLLWSPETNLQFSSHLFAEQLDLWAVWQIFHLQSSVCWFDQGCLAWDASRAFLRFQVYPKHLHQSQRKSRHV